MGERSRDEEGGGLSMRRDGDWVKGDRNRRVEDQDGWMAKRGGKDR